MNLYCNLCGKKMTKIPSFLYYNTIHNCLLGEEVVYMYDIGDECIYYEIPKKIEAINKMEQFCKSFLDKELKSNNMLYIRALRNNTIKKLTNN